MRKKITAIVLSLTILLTTLYVTAASAAESASVVYDGVSYSAPVGSDIIYTVYLQSSKSVKESKFTVNYNSTLLNTKAVSSLASDKKESDNKIELKYINNGSEDFSKETELVNITFTIIKAGKINLSFVTDSISDENGAIEKSDYSTREVINLKNTSQISESEPQKGKIININYDWIEGRIAYSTGEFVEETKKRYYTTDFISAKDFNNIDITVLDDSYRYNLFFYNGNKKYISPLEKMNPPTLNVNDTITIPNGTEYVRLEVCRAESLGGVDKTVLENKSRIYFTFLYIEIPTEPKYVPRKQGIFTEGRLTVSDGKYVTDDRNIYYVTDYIDISEMASVKAIVTDTTYRYNVFWYNSKKEYLYCEQEKNPPTLNKTKECSVLYGTVYCRLEVYRKRNLGGIEDGALLNKDKIDFCLNNKASIEPDETPLTTVLSSDSKKLSANKKKNTLKVTAVDKTINAKQLLSKSVSFKALRIKKAVGKVIYKKLKGSSKYITVKNTSNKLKINKGTKKGTYIVKIKTTAFGNKKYKSKSITKTIKIKVV